MKKIKLLQAFGTALALMVAPSVVSAETMGTSQAQSQGQDVTTQAAAVKAAIQPTNLTSTTVSPNEFGTYFRSLAPNTKYAGFLERPFNLQSAGINGMVRTEVFEGIPGTKAEGTYAYTYQVTSLENNKKQINDLEGVRFDFNSTPQNTSPITGQQTHYLQVTGNTGSLKNFKQPSLTSDNKFDAPSALNFRVLQDANGQLTQGSLTANFNDGLTPGQHSSIFSVVSKERPEKLVTVNIRGGEFVTSGDTAQKPEVWVADNGGRIVVPVPEPATFVVWAGALLAIGVAGRVRARRANG